MWNAVELRELRIFLALAEELHFGRTAERLHISQPGVSEAVRSLEARIGARLVERTSRRVSLTLTGEELRSNLIPALAAVAIAIHDRLLVVARGHRLASRTSVPIEDLADEQVALLPPPFPAALYDAILPPRTPSGRPIARTQLVRSINEIAAHVAHGTIVHVTMTSVPVFARGDAVLLPIQNLPPIALGLIWSTAGQNAKIRALAEAARSIGPSPA